MRQRNPDMALIAALLLGSASSDCRSQPPVRQTGTCRAIQARLSEAAADRYLPLCKPDQRPDPPSIGMSPAIRALQMGLWEVAAWHLDRAEDSPAVASDRSALALLMNHPYEALGWTHEAAATQASLPPQALWNQALALSALGFSFRAVATWEQVAQRREPGWSAEAAEHAAQLRAALKRRQDTADQLWSIFEKARQGTAVLSAAVAARHPAQVRPQLDILLRMASAKEEALALLPAAQAVDRSDRLGDILNRSVERVAAADFRVRGPLAREYRTLYLEHQRPDRAAPLAKLLVSARRAQQQDIVMGLLLLSGLKDGEQRAEFSRLADATRDPFHQVRALMEQGEAAKRDKDFAEAAKLLTEARRRACVDAPGLIYVCRKAEFGLGGVYASMHRPEAARRHLSAAWALHEHSVAGPRDFEEITLVFQSAELARLRYDFRSAVLFVDDWARRSESVEAAAFLDEMSTFAAINEGRMGDAWLAMSRLQGRGLKSSFQGLWLRSFLSRFDQDRREGTATLREAIAAERKKARVASRRAVLDAMEGTLLMGSDEAQAEALLRSAIKQVEEVSRWHEDVGARQARTYSYSELILAAGSRGAHLEALVLFAQELGLPSPERCALAFTRVDERSLFIVRGTGSQIKGRFAVHRGLPEETPQLEDAQRELLAGCARVDVYLRPPLPRSPGFTVLPPQFAFRLRLPFVPGAAAAAGPAKHVLIAEVEVPSELGLRPRPRAPLEVALGGAHGERRGELSGLRATPRAVLMHMRDATTIEINTKSLTGSYVTGSAALVLARDQDGEYTLTSDQIRANPLRGAPLVFLDVDGGALTVGHEHEGWGLPQAFREAGARAIFASPRAMPPQDAALFFAALAERLHRGEDPSEALRNERMMWLERQPSSWVTDVLFFE